MNIKKVLIATMTIAVAASVFSGGAREGDIRLRIGMMTIVSHPSLDAIQQGVIDALSEAGFEDGENIEIIK